MALSDNSTTTGVTVLRGPAAAERYRVPSDPDALVAYLERKREMGRANVATKAMKLNLAYYLGFQWLVWDAQRNNFRAGQSHINPNDPNAPVRLTANKIGGIVERLIAKLTKDAPIPEARPVSDNDNDVSSARVGTRILAHECDRLDWKPSLTQFMFWPTVIGTGYMHVWWDANSGDTIGTDDDDSTLFVGEVCLEHVPAWELVVDPSAMSMRDATWCIRTTTMTTEAAWERWDIGLSGGAARSLTQQVLALGQMDIDAANNDWVDVHQFWMKPCKAAPKGRVITWSGTEVIEDKPFPYEHGELPFVQCNLLPGVGTRMGRTVVNDLVPLQTDYNDSLSRFATIRRQLTPKFIGAVGQIDPSRITSRVETLLYMPGVAQTPPHLEMPNASWAQQFTLGMEKDENDMGERAGVNDATRGEAASSAPAAGIMALQEADDTKLSISASELATFISHVGRQILLLCKQYWDEERTVRVWSDDNQIESARYSGADIADRLDVHVSSESALPRSKAARVQMAMELQARFPAAFDLQMLMNVLDLPGTDLITRSLDIDTRKTNRMLSALLKGENPEVKPYDNHVIALKIINDFRKSIDYDNLPIEDQARIDAFAAIHESLVLRQMGIAVPTPNPNVDPTAQAQAEQAAQGPAGAPQAPQPGSPQQSAPPGSGAPPMDASTTATMAGIGGAGNPGRVNQMPIDTQASSMGS